MRKFLTLFCCPLIGLSQPSTDTPPIRFFAEAGGFYGSSSSTPFWLRSNQYGIVPTRLPLATLRGGLYRDDPVPDSMPIIRRKFFSIGYGLDVVGNVGLDGNTTVLIPEVYAKIRMRSFELVAGRRREIVGLVDSTLSSGSFSWSGNSLPIPKVQIGLAHYTPFPFTKGLISFRGLFAHGWFNNQGIVRNAYLHQKALYVRLGKAQWPVKLYAGFNHQVEWGGTTDELTDGLVKNGRLPASPEAYYYMMMGKSMGATPGVDTTYYSRFDRENRIGNHLGTIDIGLEVSTKAFSLLLYRQSIYEDGSLFYGTNLEDGLHGIRYRNLNPAPGGFRILGAVVEFLYTKSQGGNVFADTDKLRGKDNYFNHSQYRNGWSYFGNGIGTPFITPMADTRQELPRYGFFVNNRVRVFHAGVQGAFGQNASFLVKVSYSQNYGTYEMPFTTTVEQLSTLLQVGLPLGRSGLLATVSAAADQGGLFENSYAAYAGIRKSWTVTKNRGVQK